MNENIDFISKNFNRPFVNAKTIFFKIAMNWYNFVFKIGLQRF